MMTPERIAELRDEASRTRSLGHDDAIECLGAIEALQSEIERWKDKTAKRCIEVAKLAGENETLRGEIERLANRTDPRTAPMILTENDRLTARVAELTRRLRLVQYADAIGCCTGDCPHENAQECIEALSTELHSVAYDARAALKKGGE